jgi:prolyl 4-hydroxylase
MGDIYLQRALAHDASGRTDAALEDLARGVRAGEACCARMLGLRLLLADRAPARPSDGLWLLGEACELGLPEAAARAAGLVALGMQMAPDWSLALRWLARSANGGWLPARRQLLALCDDRRFAARADAGSSMDWRQVAATVDLDTWRRSPSVTIRHDDPRVCIVTAVASPEVCAELIELSRERLLPARVFDPKSRSDIIVPDRSNDSANFDVMSVELLHVLVQSRMAAACGVDARRFEAPSILHYDPGQQFYNHFDYFDPDVAGSSEPIAQFGQRVMTFLLYLNDDYDGGETDFSSLGFSHRGSCGDGIFFANTLSDGTPDKRSMHAGRATTRGEKWIATHFIRARPTR